MVKRSIWKYTLSVVGKQDISMPKGARVLAVQPQGDQICMWALVKVDSPKKMYTFYMYGTGHEHFSDGDEFREYIGTVQMESLVWHVFEKRRD